MSPTLYSVMLRTEEDVVTARRQARELAALLGFDGNDQTRIATAVSEIARNAFTYGRGGKAEFSVADAELKVRVSDSGPGIADVDAILRGSYRSETGMGLGIVGARRLMDGFEIESGKGKGTTVTLTRRLPAGSRSTPQKLAKISSQLAKAAPSSAMEELQRENREMLRVLDELRGRQEELQRLNAELEDTNRGVVALYAELDEKAERLRRADQMKSRFLSNMSHEFRTPLASIMALSRLLLDQADGTLGAEQQKQVTFIRKSAESLLDMVNDLLDLARVEAGKTVVRPTRFYVSSLFGALRGVLRPIEIDDRVELMFEDASALPPLLTDEAKVAQILRNFIANALKFTERGEVRVRARLSEDRKSVIFSVADTGIGISPDHLDVIFQEFAQVETPIQVKHKGTGLGLPLSKGLAELLGGKVGVESEVGRGSTFRVEIPLVYEGASAEEPSPSRCDVVLVDDEEVSRYLIRQSLGAAFTVVEASDGFSGIQMAKRHRPRAILLDLRMPGMSGFEALSELKADPSTREIPVVIVTSQTLTAEELAILNQNAWAVLSKEVLSKPDAGDRLRAAIEGQARIGASEAVSR